MARRIGVRSKKTRTLLFHNGNVRANKREVNELLVGKHHYPFVNRSTILLESMYNELEKGVCMSNVAVLTDSCASILETLVESLHIQTVAYYLPHRPEVLRWQFTPVPARLDCYDPVEG